MLRIVVMASGSGTNLQAIIDSVENKELPLEIAAVISDKRKAFALERARKHKIKDIYVNKKEFASREEFDAHVGDIIEDLKTDYIVLAGYMRILSEPFVKKFSNKIINIHPALLPKYPGIHSIERAFQAGDKVTGVTVHFVDEGVDTGPIIKQIEVPINEGDTLEKLEERVHKAEHKIYVEVLRLLAQGKLKLEGRRVKILS